MNIRWLQTFITAAEFENFRKASEALFLTQPAVSKHIRRLEEHLHIQLFKRDGKAVSLTAAGHFFLPYARDIVTSCDNGMDNFAAWKQGYNRQLTIAVAPQIASSFLPALLREFTDQFPDIEVIIKVLSSYEIGGEVGSGHADVGLSRVEPVQRNVIPICIHEEPVVLVGSAKLAIDDKLTEHVAISQFRLITHNHPDYWDQLLTSIQRQYPSVKTMAVNQVEVTKRFIEEGLGVSYLPMTMVEEDIRKGRLVEIAPLHIPSPTSKTYLNTKVETDEVQMFSQFIKQQLENMQRYT